MRLPESDITDLRTCRVGDCELKLGEQAQFKGEQGLRLGPTCTQLLQQAFHQIECPRQRRLRLGGLLDERSGVGDLPKAHQLVPQHGMRLAQADLAQRVQLGSAAAAEAELGEVEQIELTAKRRLGPQRAFGHCGQPAQARREPMDNQASLSEQPRAQHQARGGFNHGRRHCRRGRAIPSLRRAGPGHNPAGWSPG